MRRHIRILPSEQPAVWSLGGAFRLLLEGDGSDGRFALVDAIAYRSTEPPLHIHHQEDEAWYVIDGHMTFYIGDHVLEAPSGTFVYAPRGTAHTFTVDIEPTHVLVFASPAGFEHFAMELSQPMDGGRPPADPSVPPPEALAPIAERYGIEIVGPPKRIADQSAS